MSRGKGEIKIKIKSKIKSQRRKREKPGPPRKQKRPDFRPAISDTLYKSTIENLKFFSATPPRATVNTPISYFTP